MPMPTEALDRLAALAGIEAGWQDFFGRYRPVSADTKRAFLSAMGLAAADEDEAAASLAELEAAPWRQWLEPVQVVSERDGPPTVVLTVPQSHADALLTWAVAEEGGVLHQGQLRPCDLPLLAERQVDGLLRRRHQFRLPGTPFPGIHVLSLSTPDGARQTMTLIVCPAHAYRPGPETGPLWGYATQLYSLSSRRNWGMGDFSDLAELCRGAARQGAAAIGVNPLHALFPAQPERFSPYSPSSRLFLDIAYIDVEAVPDFADSVEAQRLFASPGFQAKLAGARAASLVEYGTVGALKLAVLEHCWKTFRSGHLETPDSGRGALFRAFQRAGGRKAERFATFEALQAFFLNRDPGKAYWRHWPAVYHDPEGPAVAAFAVANRERVEFFWYLQWQADQQLAAAQQAAREAGMPLGIYRDLGVGIADDGAEAWANQGLLCLGVSVGAPPDPLNLAGQDWGLVPFNPLALRQAAYRPLLAVLEANMAHAGAMRLDHAMSLQRLYWVPRGAKADQGGYLRYPVDDLFRLVALVSQRQRCLVIGEDLGTVPEGFRARMAEAGILGYRLLVFEKADGRVKRPDELSAEALVAFGTHDLPNLAGWWQGVDVATRRRLGLYPDPALAVQEAEERAADRARLVTALAAEGLLEADFPVTPKLTGEPLRRLGLAIYAYLGRSPARLLMVQFEDLLGEPVQMNLPGTTDQHPNWRYRYPLQLDAMLADPRLTEVARALAARGGARPG